MKINWNVKQGSDEWLLMRMACVMTSSEFDKAYTSSGEPSKQLEKFLEQKARESELPLSTMPTYVSGPMLRGIKNQDLALNWLSKEIGKEIKEVGFITTDDGRFGSSPDGIILGDDWNLEGVAEVKCPKLEAHRKYFVENRLPPAYKLQVHGEMAVCEAKYAWFASCFYTDEPEPRELVNQFKIKVERDDFTDLLAERLQEVHEMLLEVKKKMGLEI